MNKQTLVISVIVVALLWVALSWYWYVCGIRGLCDTGIAQRGNASEVQERDSDTVVGRTSRSNNQGTRNEKVVSTTEVQIACASYLESYIRKGYNNTKSDVVRLEEFLNQYEGESLVVDGVFGTEDQEAVKRFQLRYRTQVMDPWGMKTPSGYVFKTTRDHINTMKCALDYAGNASEIRVEN